MMLMMNESQRAMLRSYGVLVGRVLLGLMFLVAGWGKLMGEGGVAAFSKGLPEMLPVPLLIAWIVVLIELVGGAMLIVGYRVGLAAGALAVFLLLTVLLVHNPMTRSAQLPKALNNLALLGGFLYIMAYGPGEGWKLMK